MLSVFCLVLLFEIVGLSTGSVIKLNISPEVTKLRSRQSALMRSYMDLEANPCHDFYQYACGNWDKENPIPETREFWGNIHLAEWKELQKIGKLLNASSNQYISDAARKAKDFYASCMNETKIDERGLSPLLDFLKTLGGWPAIDNSWTGDGLDWLNLLVEAHRLGIGAVFKSIVYDDMFNSSRYSLTILHSELEFENGNDFLTEGRALRAYKTLIGNVLRLLHVKNDSSNKEIEDIVNFETQLAKIVVAHQINGSFIEALTPTTLEVLQTNFSSINWQRYFSNLHNRSFNSSEQVIVLTVKFLEKLDSLIKRTPKRTIFNFLMWKIVALFGPYTGKEYKAALSDVKANVPRAEQCVSSTRQHFRDAVGSMYVQKYFSKVAREDAKDLLARLKKSFANLIENASWMQKSDKVAAKLKLDYMRMEIGYPEYILNVSQLNAVYENIAINRSDYFTNMLSVLKIRQAQETKRLGKTVDKSDWPISFIEQGAIYVFTKQRLFTTAMMFRPPMYHKDLPKFMNFGGVGAMMAHEISHGFDPVGISFDHAGNANDWFSNSSKTEYKARETCFIEKYSNFSLNDTKMDGVKVLEEAIADDVGIKSAYRAYMDWMQENINSPTLTYEQLDGFTLSNEKMFFISAAQLNCEAIRPDAWPQIWATEKHTVQRYRVNGVMSNSNEFGKAFNCTVGNVMNPANKCSIW